ncbi:MAG: lytic transglycosylase domain-containing protein, partial [Candidatus Methylomirabilota bacterium]
MLDRLPLTTPPRGTAWLFGGWLLLSSLFPGVATAEPGCLERAAQWAHVHPTLLRAIAWVESAGNPSALSWNRNGSYDVGLMQINSWWYSRGLASLWPRLGDPCVNAAAGTWV